MFCRIRECRLIATCKHCRHDAYRREALTRLRSQSGCASHACVGCGELPAPGFPLGRDPADVTTATSVDCSHWLGSCGRGCRRMHVACGTTAIRRSRVVCNTCKRREHAAACSRRMNACGHGAEAPPFVLDGKGKPRICARGGCVFRECCVRLHAVHLQTIYR